MDSQSERYLSDIIAYDAFATDVKYRGGDKEHGGKLWQKPGILENIKQEKTDLNTYLFTMEYQLKVMRAYLLAKKYKEALGVLELILAKPSDEPVTHKLITDYEGPVDKVI